jgi:hypothetical protein
MYRANVQLCAVIWASVVILLGAGVSARSANAVAPSLHIAWPQHWELRTPERQAAALRLQAREQNLGVTRQILEVIAIDIRHATKAVDLTSVRDLVTQLRNATTLKSSVEKKIEVLPFQTPYGYYFTATDGSQQGASQSGYRQLVEGVLLKSGYLINFTLRTNNADNPETKKMISALAEMRIE